jgi:hypothetical protein
MINMLCLVVDFTIYFTKRKLKPRTYFLSLNAVSMRSGGIKKSLHWELVTSRFEWKKNIVKHWNVFCRIRPKNTSAHTPTVTKWRKTLNISITAMFKSLWSTETEIIYLFVKKMHWKIVRTVNKIGDGLMDWANLRGGGPHCNAVFSGTPF